MGIAKLYGQKASGININGIIKDYHAYAGENISAGDFVEYINGIAGRNDYGTSENTSIVSLNEAGKRVSAVELDGNRVFIAHSHPSVSNTYSPLFGIVVTISGATITVGTDTQLSTSDYTGDRMSAVKLDENRVFIAHSYGGNEYLSGVVCTILGTTITKGTNTSIISSSYAGREISTELLENGNVFIAHSYSDDYYLYGVVITINGTEITVGTDTKLSSTSDMGTVISTTLLENGDVFLACRYTRAIICTVSGTTITAGTEVKLSSKSSVGEYISATSLSNGNVFMAYSQSTSYVLYGMVCTINGTTITAGTETQLANISHMANAPLSTVLLSNSRVLVVHNNDRDEKYLITTIVSVDGATITPHTRTGIDGGVINTSKASSVFLRQNDTIFVAHSYDTNLYLHAQIWGIDEENNKLTNQVVATEYETQVRKTTTSQFDGVAKEVVLGGDVPVLVQGDIIPKSWTEVTTGTEYVAGDGTRIIAKGTTYSQTANRACDSNTSTCWGNSGEKDTWFTIKFPTPIKINKLKLMYGDDNNRTDNLDYFKIQVSNDNSTWIDVYNTTSYCYELTEIDINPQGLYTYYRFLSYRSTGYGNNFSIYEIQTSEYEIMEQIKDLVSIYTTYKLDTNFATRDGNAIMTADGNTFITK